MQEGPINRLETAWPDSALPGEDQPTRRSEAGKDWERKLEDWVVQHPRLALGAAAACGLLFGWYVKRK